MIAKPFIISVTILFIFIAFILFYSFYFNWYSFWYSPKSQHPNIGLSQKIINQAKQIKPFVAGVQRLVVKKDNYTAWIFVPQNTNLNTAPIILFLHGLAPVHPDYTNYYPWLYHEAARGNIVIFPIYQKTFFHPFWPKACSKIAYHLSKSAIDRVHKLAPQNNFSQFSIIGLSLGGAIATNLASMDLPWPKALILLAPGETFPFVPARLYGVPFRSLDSLPQDCRLTVVLASNDHIISRRAVMKKVIYRAIHLEKKYVFIIPSDNYGYPVLESNHLTFFNVKNPLTFNGYWKIIDATLDCSFLHQNCDIAEGTNQQSLSIGQWEDGREINPIIRFFPH